MSIVRENLRFLRKQHRLTQQVLAQHLGVKRSRLAAYEEGRAEPQPDFMARASAHFGVPEARLWHEDLTGGRPVPRRKSPKSTDATEADAPHHPAGADRSSAGTRPEERSSRGLVPKPQATPKRIVSNPKATAALVSERAATKTPGAQRMAWVSEADLSAYARRHAEPAFLESLPKLHLPMLPDGPLYRAFGTGVRTWVGRYVRNWYELNDARTYLLVTHAGELLRDRLENHIAEAGALLLSGRRVPVGEVLEIWEVVLQLAPPAPSGRPQTLEQLTDLVLELRAEVKQLGG
ncbi:MAG: helix-turn-helix transcriptional regulator [Catalinimonas sp.]